jgi:hypothetical protein
MSPADTGAAARVDSLRGVRITITATNGLTGAEERRRTITLIIRLPNAGLVNRANCGDEPQATGIVFPMPPVVVNPLTGDLAIQLSWTPSNDEGSGEKDVVRYVVWRRAPTDPAFTDLDPYVSIPAGAPSYVYLDEDVQSGDIFNYAVAAQDCTPSLSSLTTAGPVVVP